MKRALLGLLPAVFLLVRPAAAEPEPKADVEAKAEAEAEPEAEAGDFGHMGQLGLRAGLVAGYRMVFRYDSSPYCREPEPGDEAPKVCGHAAPLATELALSFGLLDILEPYVWARLGLAREEETDTDPVQILGVGARIYTMSDSAFKIFLEPAVAYEFEGGGDNPAYATNDPDYSQDLLLHLAVGPHWDLHENFGVYLDGGLTTGIIRAIHSTLELQLGIQGRLP